MAKKLFTPENQPVNRKSGPNIKARIVAALDRAGMSEDNFLDLLIAKAIEDGGVFLQEVLKRYSPIPKQTHEPITIEWPKEGTPAQKADAVLKAMSEGLMSPDVGAIFIEAISKSLGIEEVTELAKRLEAIEAILNAQKIN